jgi:CubicO group peptidase (beta-lactamase class C family)
MTTPSLQSATQPAPATYSRREIITLGLRSTALAAAVGVPVFDAAAEPPGPRQFRAAFRAVDRFVTQYMRDMNSPGMTLALANRERVLYTATYGLSNVERLERVKPEYLFHIGSITKSFVAIALLQLREEGQLDLHKPILEYLPWLKIESGFAPITSHHLLTHTSGLPDNPSIFLSDPNAKHTAAYAPGEHFHYSNLGYMILGQLLTTLDNRPLSESLRKRILDPIGMHETEPIINSQMLTRTAKSYMPLRSERPYPRFGQLIPASEIIFDVGSGSIASTNRDMGLYARMLANRGRAATATLLSSESFDLLVKPWIKAENLGPTVSYGYGLMIEQRDGHTIARHTGGMLSFASALQVDLEEGTGAFASINAMQGYRPNPVAAYSLKALDSAQNGKPPPPLPAAIPPTNIERAADFAGLFTSPEKGTLEFRAEAKRLFLIHGNENLPVQTTTEDGFLVLHPDFDRFLFRFAPAGKEQGPATEVSHGGDWYANERCTSPRSFSTPPEWEAFVGHYRNETPWLTSLRIVRRKGQLWLDESIGTDMPLAQIDSNTFRAVDSPFNPEWIRFLEIVNGKAMHLKHSGDDFWRVDSP